VTDDNDKRAAYIEGLHQIADFLAEHPEVPLPHLGAYAEGSNLPAMSIYVYGDEPRVMVASIARAMAEPGAAVQKRVKESTESYQVWREFGGLVLVATANRNEVCERVVTGAREVTEEVPDPEALAAVPKVSVTKVVEDVEWVCAPLLKTPSKSLLRVPDGS
jgi:hypothetical protein